MADMDDDLPPPPPPPVATATGGSSSHSSSPAEAAAPVTPTTTPAASPNGQECATTFTRPKVSAATAAAIAASRALRGVASAAIPSPATTAASTGASAASSAAASASASLPAHRRTQVWSSLLQRSYNPPFLSPSACIVHHPPAVLKKFGSKLTPSSLNARHFLLTQHSLQYFKDNPWRDPQGRVSLEGATLAEEPDALAALMKPPPPPNCCFSILPRASPSANAAAETRKYLFVCDDPTSRAIWLDLLSSSTDASKRASLTEQPAAGWADDVNLVLEGWATKLGADVAKQSWKRRYMIYTRATHSLAYYKSPPPRAAGFVAVERQVVIDVARPLAATAPASPAGESELQKFTTRTLASVPPSVDAQCCLAYTADEERCYVLLASSRQERDEWLLALRRAVEYCEGKAVSWTPEAHKPVPNLARAATVPVRTGGGGGGGIAATIAAFSKPSPSSAAANTPSRPPPAAASSSSSFTAPASAAAASASSSAASSAASSTASSPSAAPQPSPSSPSGAAAATPGSPPNGSSGSLMNSPLGPRKVLAPSRAQQSGAGSGPGSGAASSSSSPSSKPLGAPPSPPKTASASAPVSSSPAASSSGVEDDEWDDAALLSGTRTHGASVAYVSLAAMGLATSTKTSPTGTKVGSPTRGLPRKPGFGSSPSLAIAEDEEEEEDGPAVDALPAAALPPFSPSNSVASRSAGTGAPGLQRAVTAPTTPSASSRSSSNASGGGGGGPAGDQSLVEKSLAELYSTEASYVAGLNTVCTAFLLRFRKHVELGLQPIWFEAGELERLQIFQHVVAIRDINARLLKELEAISNSQPPSATPSSSSSSSSTPATMDGARMQHLARIGSTFRQFIPFFKVYSSYAKCYGDLKTLEELAGRRTALANFLALTAACEGNTLASLMITPVQRVGRYVLLLETVLRNAPKPSADAGSGVTAGLSDVSAALEEMRQVGSLINAAQALWEATSKVLELQAKIDAPILQPGRFLVREGVLKKVYKRDKGVSSGGAGGFFATLTSNMAKKEAAFTFFLLNDSLLQTKKSALQDRFALRAAMPLHGMVLEDLPDAGLGTSNEIKNAWTITYNATATEVQQQAGSATAAVAAGSPTAAAPAPVASPSSSKETGSVTPSSMSRTGSVIEGGLQSNPLAERSGSGGDFEGGPERKILTVLARDAEEKAKWMQDLQNLIEQSSRNKATLRT